MFVAEVSIFLFMVLVGHILLACQVHIFRVHRIRQSFTQDLFCFHLNNPDYIFERTEWLQLGDWAEQMSKCWLSFTQIYRISTWLIITLQIIPWWWVELETPWFSGSMLDRGRVGLLMTWLAPFKAYFLTCGCTYFIRHNFNFSLPF